MHELIIPPDPKPIISREFLKVFNQLRKSTEPGREFELAEEPTKCEIKFLIDNYVHYFGLIRNPNANWLIIGGDNAGIDIRTELEDSADIIAHSHQFFTMPAGHDALYAIEQKRKEFIISDMGIVYFTGIKRHPVTGDGWHPKNEAEVDQLEASLEQEHRQELLNSPRSIRAKMLDNIYKKFLEKMGVVVIQEKWEELPERNPLSKFPLRMNA